MSAQKPPSHITELENLVSNLRRDLQVAHDASVRLVSERDEALAKAAQYKNALWGHVEYPSIGSAWEKAAEYKSALDKARVALQRVWDEDECGWIVDSSDMKECVKCGTNNQAHTEDCTQGFIHEALAAINEVLK